MEYFGLGKNFVMGFGMVIIALISALFGQIFFAILLGIIGAVIVIWDMLKSIFNR